MAGEETKNRSGTGIRAAASSTSFRKKKRDGGVQVDILTNISNAQLTSLAAHLLENDAMNGAPGSERVSRRRRRQEAEAGQYLQGKIPSSYSSYELFRDRC